MKLPAILLSAAALCGDIFIFVVPGDNSHYIKGFSHYIWMPDGYGTPHLVDLQAPADEVLLNSLNGANNEYWLFTRLNPIIPQVIVNGNANTIWESNYLGIRPLKVIVHGWNNDGNSPMNTMIASAFLAVVDANVIVVDWGVLASSDYTTAVEGVPSVGRHLGNFLTWLINTAGGDWSEVHLVGFSLGAHVVGIAGRVAGGTPARVTGLDPAGPRFGDNVNALSRDSGLYVESIHTDGGMLGIFDPISHADFYPNGGKNPQPGCVISTCSHGRASELFAASIRYNRLIGRRCKNIWETQLSKCSGEKFHMGNAIISKRGSGLYSLSTGSSWPFQAKT